LFATLRGNTLREVARALADANSLEGFLTLLPDERAFRWLPALARRALPRAIARNAVPYLPRHRVHTLRGPLLAYKAARYFNRDEGMGDLLAWTFFDLWAATHVRRRRPGAVIGYEMCAVETFRAAKGIGAKCIQDAAAFHYAVRIPFYSLKGTTSTARHSQSRCPHVARSQSGLARCRPTA
jgi:hypothetical protein